MARDLSREPVSLASAKKHLGIRTDFRDEEIADLIVGARQQVEHESGMALVRRELVDNFAAFKDGTGAAHKLAYGPVHSVAAVSYLDGEGELVEVDPLPRVLQTGEYQWKLFPSAGSSWPALGAEPFVAVRYEAGYGPLADDPQDGAVEVPETLRRAVLLLIGHWFENHEGAVVGTIAAELPFGVRDLCRPFRPAGIA